MSKMKKTRRKLGDVIVIPLGDGNYSYGRVLQEPLIAFYDLRSNEILSLETIITAPIAFIISVMNYCITEGIWPIIGNAPLPADLLKEPLFFKKDPLTGALTIYRDSTGEEFPATREECEHLECEAVWEPHHVVDRLQDHFVGRPNKWAESLRP